MENTALDVQSALLSHGIYRTEFGHIRFSNQTEACGSMGVEAHRGSQRFAENSQLAIFDAVAAGYSSVEIDVQQLGDGTWVIHHDTKTGRTVKLRSANYELRQLSAADWRSAVLIDRNGRYTKETPPFALEAIKLFSAAIDGYGDPKRPPRLNIEVKTDSRTTCSALRQLQKMTSRYISTGSYSFSSSDIDALACLRGGDKNVYLALILRPSSKSLHEWAAKADPEMYAKGKKFLRPKRFEERLASYWDGKSFGETTSQKGLKSIRENLGPNSGLNMDIRDVLNHPDIGKRVRAAGMAGTATYTINDPAVHTAGLKRLLQLGALPDTAIIDEFPYYACSSLFGTRTKGTAVVIPVTSEQAKLVTSLPHDADFSRLDDLAILVTNGNYLHVSGDVRPIPRTLAKQQASQRTLAGPAFMSEEAAFELPKSEKVFIRIDRSQSHE
jgi:glycerophosphoryl diester phosphodiesterase